MKHFDARIHEVLKLPVLSGKQSSQERRDRFIGNPGVDQQYTVEEGTPGEVGEVDVGVGSGESLVCLRCPFDGDQGFVPASQPLQLGCEVVEGHGEAGKVRIGVAAGELLADVAHHITVALCSGIVTGNLQSAADPYVVQ
ncbi:hypothetical protein [Rhizohabitans arisaemae]|uniref:hypothetical protein n=1 Tax=Rhizohabitans arisaemae TaxID=2720610 RepID=UPI0024B26084|nr:hypothetical protein [Rhizohabitans arisaemae]